MRPDPSTTVTRRSRPRYARPARLTLLAAIAAGLLAGSWLGFTAGQSAGQTAAQPDAALDEPAAGSPALPANVGVNGDLETRRERVRQMSSRDQAELLRKKERFDRLSPAEQQRMRQLHDELSHDPRAPQLLNTLASYSAWLQTLTAAERAELLSMEPQARVDQIRQWQQEQRRDEAGRLGIPQVTIPVEDAKLVMEWIETYLQRSRPHFERRTPQLAERLQQTTDRKRQHFMLVYTLMQTFNEPDAIPPIDPAEMQALAEKLSEAHRKQLLAAATAKEQLELILRWCRAAFLRQFEPTRDELEKHYRESLTAEDREWLDAMPRQRFQQTLRSLYFRDRQPPPDWNRRFPGGRSRGPGGGPGPGPGGPGPGGPGPGGPGLNSGGPGLGGGGPSGPGPGNAVPSNSAPSNTAPGNSAPGNTAPGNTVPGNVAPSSAAPGNAEDARQNRLP